MVIIIILVIITILMWLGFTYIGTLREISKFCKENGVEVFGLPGSSEMQLMSNYIFLNNLFSKESVLSCSNEQLKVLLLKARKMFILQLWFGLLLCLASLSTEKYKYSKFIT